MATASDSKTNTTDPSDQPDPAHRPAWRCPGLIAGFALFAIACLSADLVFKTWSFNHVADQPVVFQPDAIPDIPYHPPRTVIPGLLSLQLTLNQGALFGIGHGNRWLFVVISIAAVAIISWMFANTQRKQHWSQTALALVLAGAIGNMVDRVSIGAVRDMLYLFPGKRLPFGWSWPGGQTDIYPWIFNLADVFLIVGLAMLAIPLLFASKPKPETHA